MVMEVSMDIRKLRIFQTVAQEKLYKSSPAAVYDTAGSIQGHP